MTCVKRGLEVDDVITIIVLDVSATAAAVVVEQSC